MPEGMALTSLSFLGKFMGSIASFYRIYMSLGAYVGGSATLDITILALHPI